MDAFASLHDRIDRALERAHGGSGDAALLRELNDVLCEGYAEALQAEAGLIRLEERLAERIAAPRTDPADDLRVLAREHRASEQEVARLRARLAVAHQRFRALGGAARPTAR
jgi:cell division septum initiation protein DivIVA